jgi:hypothetical protein
MKKLLLILLCLPMIGFGQQTSLIFSEYGEGSSFNKWIEIYNPTPIQMHLDNYRYNFCWNGCNSLQWEFSIPFDSGYILLPGETYLLTHYNADSVLLAASNQKTNILSNGNDVAALVDHLGVIIDIIGEFDSVSTVAPWDVDGIVNATENHTMIRDPDICIGNFGNWSLSDGSIFSSEWIVGSSDDFSNINSHSSNCYPPTVGIEEHTTNKQLLRTIDLLGRETKNQPLFYIYDDGTVEKRIVIE